MAAKKTYKINASGDVVTEDETSATRLDVLGFSLNPKQFIIVLLFSMMMLGFNGTLALLGVIGLYIAFQRYNAAGGRSTSGSNIRWGGGKNIKGIKDLPKPPQGG